MRASGPRSSPRWPSCIIVSLLLSSFLARTIVRPLRRLALAAHRVRLGRAREVRVPRLPSRSDEIGLLARAVSDMSQSLRHRIDNIEAFAADVTHELKNPLASLRSAVDGLDRVEDPELRRQLLGVARDDVGRLDRLINDISEAARTDAELARAPFEHYLQGAHSYEVNSPLWSDGAAKRRWMALPNDSKIELGDDGHFNFPKGTVLVKEFALGTKVVETRLFVRHDDGTWAGYTYAWSDDGKDADLVPNGAVKTFGNQSWTYPSQGQCLQCHNSNAGFSLGLTVAQLNRKVGSETQRGIATRSL